MRLGLWVNQSPPSLILDFFVGLCSTLSRHQVYLNGVCDYPIFFVRYALANDIFTLY